MSFHSLYTYYIIFFLIFITSKALITEKSVTDYDTLKKSQSIYIMPTFPTSGCSFFLQSYQKATGYSALTCYGNNTLYSPIKNLNKAKLKVTTSDYPPPPSNYPTVVKTHMSPEGDWRKFMLSQEGIEFWGGMIINVRNPLDTISRNSVRWNCRSYQDLQRNEKCRTDALKRRCTSLPGEVSRWCDRQMYFYDNAIENDMKFYIHRYEDGLFNTEETWTNLFNFLGLDVNTDDVKYFDSMVANAEQGRKPIHNEIGRAAKEACPSIDYDVYRNEKECINKMGYTYNKDTDEWTMLKRTGPHTFENPLR